MQVRTDCRTTRHQVEQAVRHFARIEGAQADARDRAAIRDHFDQRREIDSWIEIVAIAAEMDARQNDFLVTGVGQLAHLFQHFARRDAAAEAARGRNDAVSACVVAAFLNF